MTPLPAPINQSCPKAATSGEGLPRWRHSATIGRVSRPQLAVHGHFYQPERRDPFSGEIAPQPAAAPYRDWNARIDAECYKPNAERGNLRHISYDLGPTLASWLRTNDAATHQGFVDSDAPLGVDDRDRAVLQVGVKAPGNANRMTRRPLNSSMLGNRRTLPSSSSASCAFGIADPARDARSVMMSPVQTKDINPDPRDTRTTDNEGVVLHEEIGNLRRKTKARTARRRRRGKPWRGAPLRAIMTTNSQGSRYVRAG